MIQMFIFYSALKFELIATKSLNSLYIIHSCNVYLSETEDDSGAGFSEVI